jgi:hypothetical protein
LPFGPFQNPIVRAPVLCGPQTVTVLLSEPVAGVSFVVNVAVLSYDWQSYRFATPAQSGKWRILRSIGLNASPWPPSRHRSRAAAYGVRSAMEAM